MDASLVQLRMLRELELRETIAAAANSLGYTASAVSQQLSNLETSVGTALLERVGRNVRFTDAGRVLVEHAAEILAQLDSAQAAIEASSTEVRGSIQVTAFESVAANILPDLVSQLGGQHPDLTIRTRLLGPDLALDGLLSGDVDLAFTIDDAASPIAPVAGVTFDHVFDDRFFLVLPLDDAVAKRTKRGTPVALAEVADRPFVGPDLDGTCGQLIATACAQAGFRPDVVHHLDDYRTALALVAAGHGVSLIPDLGLPCDVDGVRVLCLAEPVSRQIKLAFRTTSEQRPAITAVRTALAQLMNDQRFVA